MARRQIFGLGLALVSATGAIAQSQCPTASDLVRGIRVDYADGSAEVFRPQRPGVMKVDGMIDGQLAYRMEIAQGTHLLRYEDIVQGRPVASSVNEYDYSLAPLEMPVPQPGDRWQADVLVTTLEGERREAQSQVYDQVDPVEIGECTYDRVPVVIAYDTEDGYLEGVAYLPALGLGFLVWSETDDGERVGTDPVRISVAQK